MKKSPDLGFGCKGNGITVWDRSRLEGWDYKTVAHIDPCGAIKYLDKRLPEDAKRKIDESAERMASEFRESFLRMDRFRAMTQLIDIATVRQLVELPSGLSTEQIYELYIRLICENMHREMPRAYAEKPIAISSEA